MPFFPLLGNAFHRLFISAGFPVFVKLRSVFYELVDAYVSPFCKVVIIEVGVAKGEVLFLIELGYQPVEPNRPNLIPLVDCLLLDGYRFSLIKFRYFSI